jgi:endonuclease YncB( thermonuclease family)
MNHRRCPLIGLALIAVGLLCLSASPAASEIRDHATVVDGDTLHIGRVSIRLAGIDAPELGQTCRRPDNVAWDCGLDARRMLAQKIGDAPVSCSQLYSDVYDRVFAICTASNGDDLSAAMVSSGYALADGRDQRYLTEETAARLAGKGMWSGSFQTPWEWRARQLEAADE